ncbi:zinc metalloproteinase nas-13-like [Cloeon dipterum]|uniref:zinc metalloproteinase nas-13-like n=1 Tax=Cloeon dipterum TaxID=197152 RepID=UPI0032200166
MRLATFICFTWLVCAAVASPLPEVTREFNDANYRAELNKVRMLSIGKPDSKVGYKLRRWNPNSGVNPEELGSYLEGDMLVPPSTQGRNGLINTYYRWPNAEVFYKFNGTFNENQTALIYKAFDAYHAKTCIRFKPYNGSQSSYVVINSENTGCWATVGRYGGMQYVNLQIPGCVTIVGTVIHEFMHTIGFYHEHARTDRDQWIKILWENVDPGSVKSFDIRNSTSAFGVAYDYGSVMHYSAKSFSSNGQPTIETIQPPGALIGQRSALSDNDVQKINIMYKCVV